MMDGLVLLLLISMGCLCNAGLTYYNSQGFAISGSEESDEEIGNELSCGMSETGGQFKIEKRITIGGTDAKYIEFPWMVVLFAPVSKQQDCGLTDSSCWFVRCGGSLINAKVVLLTARCVYPYLRNKLKVRAGDWNLDTFEEQHPYQERFVSKMIIHPQYQDSELALELRYDAALLIMESPYTSADNIGFICLPPPNLNMASTGCKVAGWGVKTFMATGYQSLLKVVDLNYADYDQCQWTLRQNWWSSLMLHDSFMCAGGVRDKGGCQGDGGSPLMCFAEDHYYARGLFSWTVGCGLENIPQVYTDVVKVRNWIDQQMIANGFTTDTYTHVAYRK